jgi:hypothetical protein
MRFQAFAAKCVTDDFWNTILSFFIPDGPIGTLPIKVSVFSRLSSGKNGLEKFATWEQCVPHP